MNALRADRKPRLPWASAAGHASAPSQPKPNRQRIPILPENAAAVTDTENVLRTLAEAGCHRFDWTTGRSRQFAHLRTRLRWSDPPASGHQGMRRASLERDIERDAAAALAPLVGGVGDACPWASIRGVLSCNGSDAQFNLHLDGLSCGGTIAEIVNLAIAATDLRRRMLGEADPEAQPVWCVTADLLWGTRSLHVRESAAAAAEAFAAAYLALRFGRPPRAIEPAVRMISGHAKT